MNRQKTSIVFNKIYLKCLRILCVWAFCVCVCVFASVCAISSVSLLKSSHHFYSQFFEYFCFYFLEIDIYSFLFNFIYFGNSLEFPVTFFSPFCFPSISSNYCSFYASAVSKQQAKLSLSFFTPIAKLSMRQPRTCWPLEGDWKTVDDQIHCTRPYHRQPDIHTSARVLRVLIFHTRWRHNDVPSRRLRNVVPRWWNHPLQ